MDLKMIKPRNWRLHKPDWLNNRYLLLASLFYGLMFVLASIKGLERTFIWTFNDKLLHFAAYSVLTALVYLGLRSRPSGEFFLPRLLWCWAIVCGLGALDELAQALVARDASFDDWLADIAAAIVMLLLIALGHSLRLLWNLYRPNDDLADDQPS